MVRTSTDAPHRHPDLCPAHKTLPTPASPPPQHPLLLKGHERPITIVKFNADGDLFVSAAKDKHLCLWRTDNGERVGTFEGHSGAVYGLDMTRDSRFLLSGAADAEVRVWELLTGRELLRIQMQGPVKGVAWAEGEREFAVITDRFSGRPAALSLFTFDPESARAELRLTIPEERQNFTRLGWLPLNVGVLVALADGALRSYDPLRGTQKIERVHAHNDVITSFAFNENKTLMVTASKDQTALLWDVKDLTDLHKAVRDIKPIRRYALDVPCNAAAISPTKEHVVVGGGQDAMAVTTTAASAGRFEARFHHMVLENELGRVRGHFGPINSLDIAPDGLSFVTGAEEGYIRLHKVRAGGLRGVGAGCVRNQCAGLAPPQALQLTITPTPAPASSIPTTTSSATTTTSTTPRCSQRSPMGPLKCSRRRTRRRRSSASS